MPLLFLFIAIIVLALNYRDESHWPTIKRGVLESPGNILLLVIVFGLIKMENIVQDIHPFPWDFTPLFYSIEGNKYILLLQGAIENVWFVHAIAIFYLTLFTAFILAIPVFYTLTGDREQMRTYTYILFFNYIVLVPFYLFFNVTVTSMYPPGTPVKPLLYQHSDYLSVVLLVDRLNDCFPSGHISLTLSLMFMAFLRTDNRMFRAISTAVFVFTVFSVIYLGIHWLTDVFGGMVLALGAYYASVNPRVRVFLGRAIDGFNRRFWSFFTSRSETFPRLQIALQWLMETSGGED